MFDKITPQTILKVFNKHHVCFINTLNNSHIVIQKKKNKDLSCCYIKDNVDIKDIKKKYKLIILYCANSTCSASYDYANFLVKKGISKSRIAVYKGGIHEWCMYSLLMPKIFTIKFRKR